MISKTKVLAFIMIGAAAAVVVVLVMTLAPDIFKAKPPKADDTAVTIEAGKPKEIPAPEKDGAGAGDEAEAPEDIRTDDDAYAGPWSDKYDPHDLSTAVKDVPEYEALDFIWECLSGYWTAAPNWFFAFIRYDGSQFFEYGLLQSGFGESGNVLDAAATGKYEVQVKLNVVGFEGNEMDDPRPDRTETIYLDLSGLDQDGKFNIKGDFLGDGNWHTFAFGGNTMEEVYQ